MKILQHLSSVRFLRVATSALAMIALAALPVLAQQGKGKGKGGGGDNDPDRAVKGSTFPAGWNVRPDRGTASQINFTESGGVYKFVMGPAGTFYNNSWTKSGNYKYSARVAQAKAPSHPTSYGIMVGGSNLNTDMPTYTYFLTRNSGDFYIANWEGARPTAVVNWTTHASINKQAADGKQSNTLGVEVQGDNVIFTVNGTEVRRVPKAQVHTDGLIGFRIGHNMDVDIDQIMR